VKALDHIQATADAEGGIFFVSGDGTLTFHDRLHRATNPTIKATFGDSGGLGEVAYQAVDPRFDRDNIRNDVTITLPGGVVVSATDTASVTRYGRRQYDTSPDLTSTVEAQSQATYLLYRYKDPHLRIESLTLRPYDLLGWGSALNLEVSDRIRIRFHPPGGGGTLLSQDCFVEQVRVDGRPGAGGKPLCDFTYQLSPADLDVFWILGDSVYGILGTTTIPGPW